MSINLSETSCHTQALQGLRNIFPSMVLPSMEDGASLSDILQGVIKTLPKPRIGEIPSTINSMKDVVDRQELKIQKNMIQLESVQPTLSKKVTNSTMIIEEYSDMGWQENESEHIDSVWRWDNRDGIINTENQKSYFAFVD